jgi:hypothetical protein
MSITLTQIASMSIGGVAIESDANAALTYMEVSYPNNLRLFFGYGTTTGQSFSSGTNLPKVIVTLNVATGAWSSSNGLSGTLLSSGLTTLQTALLNMQNGLETFAVNQNITPGVQVAWTTTEL